MEVKCASCGHDARSHMPLPEGSPGKGECTAFMHAATRRGECQCPRFVLFKQTSGKTPQTQTGARQ